MAKSSLEADDVQGGSVRLQAQRRGQSFFNAVITVPQQRPSVFTPHVDLPLFGFCGPGSL